MIDHAGQNENKVVSFEAKTMVLKPTKEETLGPRFVCTSPSGVTKIHPLKKEKFIIGRSHEADLNLLDPSVSRKHCVVEKRKDGFFARNISTTNPLYLNDEPIAEKRLYAGDQVKIGAIMLAFISDRPEDARAYGDQLTSQDSGPGWALWAAVSALVLILGAYLIYSHAYTPWKTRQALNSISRQIKSGKYQPAQDTLKRLLASDLSTKNTQLALQLLAQTTQAITQEMAKEGNYHKTIDYLMNYLAVYGGGKEAEILWDRLDYYRLRLGEFLESSEQYQPALRQYAAIREDSVYFGEAQKAIRRIWLAYQQPPGQAQTVAQLLKEAEAHFRAKRFLTPVNQNAYAVYQAVLALEPEHELALKRIGEMQAFYRKHGEMFFKKAQWSRALTYFERYCFIDPEADEIKEKISICRQKLTATKTRNKKGASSKYAATQNRRGKQNQTQDEKRNEIKRMLEESGTESSWIMEYLFEEKGKKKDPDKPW